MHTETTTEQPNPEPSESNFRYPEVILIFSPGPCGLRSCMSKNEAEIEAAGEVVVVMVSHSILSSFCAHGWNTLSDRTNSPNSITPFCFTSKSWKTCHNSKAAAIKMNPKEKFWSMWSLIPIFQIVCLHLLTNLHLWPNQPTTSVAQRQRERERERERGVTRSAKRFSLFLFLNSANWNSSCRESEKMLQGLHPSNLRNLQTEQKTCNRWGTTSCLQT